MKKVPSPHPPAHHWRRGRQKQLMVCMILKALTQRWYRGGGTHIPGSLSGSSVQGTGVFLVPEEAHAFVVVPRIVAVLGSTVVPGG